MAASEIEQWWIDKFQENLGPIRKVAGWTVDDPIEQRIRERRAQEQDGEAVADNAPVNTDGGNVADNAATEKRKPSAATLKASKTAATGKPTLSTAMQALAVITGALASGTAAGIITYLMFPDGGPNKR